ncbi:uncharacterized protein [Typha angustifolia]|uniref:uncharacterized protein n=1 Tax=Typha angustifolia TaxID=59011 RepID=UPI003C2ACE5F
MTKKRKSEANRLDEVDRTMYATFRGAANSLSQMYTQAMAQKRVAFQAGERHALEKIYRWILTQHEEGSRVVVPDIVAYLQKEIDCGEDGSMSPRSQYPHQHSQSLLHSTSPNIPNPSALFGQVTTGVASRTGHIDQTRNTSFANDLSNHVRHGLTHCHLSQCGEYNSNGVVPNGNHGASYSNQSQEPNYPGLGDFSMDMHSDSP